MKILSDGGKAMVLVSALGLLGLLAGCSFKPVVDETRFYVLSASDPAPASVDAPEGGAILGIARVRVARYLDSPGMAIRERGHSMKYSTKNRWAEPLEHGVARMLAESLGREAAVAHVVAYPAQRRPFPDFELHVSVLRAEGVIDGGGARAVFQASWELRGGDEDAVVASGQVMEENLPWDGGSFEQLAASLSTGALSLAQQVARAVEEKGGRGK